MTVAECSAAKRIHILNRNVISLIMKFERKEKTKICQFVFVCFGLPPAQTKSAVDRKNLHGIFFNYMSSNDILSSLGRTTLSIDYEFKEFLIRSSSLEGAVKIVLACPGMHTIQLILTIDNI